MDIATIIGIVLGISLIILAILAEGQLSTFWSISSILIVLGGVIASTLIHYPLSKVIRVINVVRIAFQGKSQDSVEIIMILIHMAKCARREGLLALEGEVDDLVNDEFLKKGLQLVIDGTEPELVRNILQNEVIMMEERHNSGAAIFETMGASAPAFGMIGTLIGLVMMMKKIKDPSTLGPGMALALLTTFYGTLLANLIFIPIAGKLKLKSNEEVFMKEIMIEGILSVQAGENPRIVAEKMKSFLSIEEKIRLDRLMMEERT